MRCLSYSRAFEYFVILVSLIGALLVASNGGRDIAFIGYILFFISSLSFVYIGLKKNLVSVWVVNAAFAVINVFGIIQYHPIISASLFKW